MKIKKKNPKHTHERRSRRREYNTTTQYTCTRILCKIYIIMYYTCLFTENRFPLPLSPPKAIIWSMLLSLWEERITKKKKNNSTPWQYRIFLGKITPWLHDHDVVFPFTCSYKYNTYIYNTSTYTYRKQWTRTKRVDSRHRRRATDRSYSFIFLWLLSFCYDTICVIIPFGSPSVVVTMSAVS